jgi:hypothetical protein
VKCRRCSGLGVSLCGAEQPCTKCDAYGLIAPPPFAAAPLAVAAVPENGPMVMAIDGGKLSGDEMIFLGHGLKDIGNKESFSVRLPRKVAGDAMDRARESFDAKWPGASAL